jgi:AcrR family transcriptional regulator
MDNPPKKVRGNQSPRSKESVRDAILEATSKLLLNVGPGNVSIREIARAANVKHPLIYRHFGSKGKLIMAVHMRHIDELRKVAATVETIDGNVGKFFGAMERNRWKQIALARAMIDGVDPHLLQDQFPIMERLVQLLRVKLNQNDGPDDPRILAATLGATALGWLLFQPFLSTAAGLDDVRPEMQRDGVIGFLERFIASASADQNR